MKNFKMRDATIEEQQSIMKHIESISYPTGVNFWDISTSPDLNNLAKQEKAELVIKLLKQYLAPKYAEVLNNYDSKTNLVIYNNEVFGEFEIIVGNDDYVLDISCLRIIVVDVHHPTKRLPPIAKFYKLNGCKNWNETITFLRSKVDDI